MILAQNSQTTCVLPQNYVQYDYKYLVNYPNNLKNLSLLNSTNRDFIKEGLNKNSSRNAFNINYWNYNLIIDSYSKEKNKDFSFPSRDQIQMCVLVVHINFFDPRGSSKN